ncbi:unnamed protein product [Clonostachys chloroleuca]|uniref:ER transporter 6TM N-terminal domain-containing protein n=1 Tax=Clonostachys chloroleuca TaxID=1926264 RepID=A0AA35LVE6_9HYPO|nr:unnamed protein product [Clonostachys chloroleuca]
MDPSRQSLEMQESVALGDDVEGTSQPEPKLTTLKRFISKVRLDASTLILMFKGSIPPIIGISIYQSPPIYTYFTTSGYLVPVVSVLTVAILPRDRFVQTLILNVLAICVGSAVSLLALWSSIQARTHTSPPASSNTTSAVPPYNSSQSAVCAVWLFANIWFANLVRAKLPSFGLPMVLYSILINTSTTLGPTITTNTAAEAFIREQLLAMLLGVGLSAGVALFIFPFSSRTVVIGELKEVIGLLRKVVGLQREYLTTLAREDVFAIETTNAEEREVLRNRTSEEKVKFETMNRVMKEAVRAITVLAGKTHGNMTYAKRDIAWGKLDAKDLSKAFTLIRNVTIPMRDIFHRVSERRRWRADEDTTAEIVAERNWERQVWNGIMKQIYTPFQNLTEAVDQGLEHSGICLEILPKPKLSKQSRGGGSVDVEAHADRVSPGDQGFGNLVENKVRQIDSQKVEILRTWARDEERFAHPPHLTPSDAMARNQTQLYMSLYMQQLMHAAGEAIQQLVVFADERVEKGIMKHRRLIFPSEHLLWKWLSAIFSQQTWGEKCSPDILETNKVHYGDSYNQRKDLECLPATNVWQRLGNGLRKIPAVLGSKESTFGFRVACAAMSVGIVAFLEQSQTFFHDQRLDWAMITIALGMTITSGQSIFGFLCRLGGTFLGMIFSLIIWYIVDQKTPGVIVFMWSFTFVEYYFFKFPRIIPAVMMTIITQIIIIAYELQVRRLGQHVATESGQPYYPTYLLAPYRFAVVAGGIAVAFFWTIFPSPITDRIGLRQDLSATIYLLANYFSVIISTMKSQLEDTGGDIESETSPAYHLLIARRKIFSRIMRLMSSIESHVAWQRWEPTIGGRFPVRTYQQIIMHTKRIMRYLTLMSYVLTHAPLTHETEGSHEEEVTDPEAGASGADAEAQDNRWFRALSQVLPEAEPTNHTVLAALTLLSNSMLSGQNLPPYLLLPQPYETLRRLAQLPEDDRPAKSEQDGDSLPLIQDGSRESGNAVLTTIDLRQETSDAVLRKRIEPKRHLQSEQPDISPTWNNRLPCANLELRGYAEFVAVQVCSTLVCDDLEGLARAVSGLVGIVDFSFHIDEGGRDSRDSKVVEKKLDPPKTTRIDATRDKGKANGD